MAGASNVSMSLTPKYKYVKSGANPLPPSIVPEEVTVLSSENLPNKTQYMPEVGNGHIATVVQSDSIFMNGLYNGANITSHRARISSPSGYSITATNPAGLQRKYSLDMGRGLFTESYTSADVNITLRTYAHRAFTSLLITELVMEREDPTTHVDVTLHVNCGDPSDDVDFDVDESGILHGRTREAEYPELAPRTDFFMFTTPSLEGTHTMAADRQVESYLGMTVINRDRGVVLKEYYQALQSFEDGILLSSHVQEWTTMWKRGRIDMEGNITVARINYACLYYILSSLPLSGNQKNWPFIGLSPDGLAHGGKNSKDNDGYLGHIFWDQDIWMFPPIALLYPDLGRILVETRTRTLAAAQLLARRSGWEGAKYPWESAFTGLETCPEEPYGDIEIHINGAVPMMVQHLWQLTYDKEMMINGSAADVVWETAKFWVSRATYDPVNDSYRILGVMPPDEWHSPVNNSAYTNYIAVRTLKFANMLKKELGQPPNATWAEVCDKMYLSYDPKLDYHPEFEGFSPTQGTKQADVVLLGYPLMVTMNTSTKANDLIIYEKSTPVGPAPAMTWGMFLIGWLDLENETKAAELFTRSMLNVQEPFLVWSENSNGSGATNFLTGMGGYLQSVLFGYGGIRLYDDRMIFNPKLVNGTIKIALTGVSYQGSKLDLQYCSSNMTVTLTSIESGFPGLQIKLKDSPEWQELKLGQFLSVKRQSFEVRRRV